MANHSKRMPLYSQIREFIVDGLKQNKWRANDHLPTEAELSDQFGVKKALAELVEEGLIYRIQGKGSFISHDIGNSSDFASSTRSVSKPFNPVLFLVPSFQNPLVAQILSGAEAELSAQGFHLLCRSSNNDKETESSIIQECIRAGVKGIIIFPADGAMYSEEILRLTINRFPIVVIDRYLMGIDTNCVCSDNAQGAFEAAEHLIGLGHRNLAFVTVYNKETSSLEDRRIGFERALIKHGLTVDPSKYLCKFLDEHHSTAGGKATDESKLAYVRSYLQQHPDITAAVAATSWSGVLVMQAAEQLGIRIPEQLSLIHFDDYPFSNFLRVPPSCIVQQEENIGAEAGKLLMSVIADPLQDRKQIMLPTKMLIRHSTAGVR
jgi:GntR family transcriptional regulator of arabinose operon